MDELPFTLSGWTYDEFLQEVEIIPSDQESTVDEPTDETYFAQDSSTSVSSEIDNHEFLTMIIHLTVARSLIQLVI